MTITCKICENLSLYDTFSKYFISKISKKKIQEKNIKRLKKTRILFYTIKYENDHYKDINSEFKSLPFQLIFLKNKVDKLHSFTFFLQLLTLKQLPALLPFLCLTVSICFFLL